MTDILKDVRLPFMVSRDEAAAIDAWRYANRVPSRAEAMRQLMQRGLAQYVKEVAPAPGTAASRTLQPPDVGVAARLVENPYPTGTIASISPDSVKDLGARVSGRLKAKIDWLAKVKGRYAREEIADMLEAGFQREVERLHITI